MAFCIQQKAFLPQQCTRVARPRCVTVRAAAKINESIRKDEAKVVRFRGDKLSVNVCAQDTLATSEVEKQVAMCRCWKSGTFPKCDGTHVKHNKETGDNVGPLLVKKD